MKVKSTTNVNCHRKYSPKKVWMYSNCEMPNSAVLLSKVHTYIQRSTFLYSYSFLGVFYTNLGRQFTYPTHCRFLMPDNTQIILTEIWHHFWLKNDDEKWSRKNYFEIPRWPLEIPANLPGQFSLSGQIFLHWAAATLKAIVEFQNNFF